MRVFAHIHRASHGGADMFDLKGKVAIVTGGNGGIGLGMGKGLAKAGARVVVAARDPAKSSAAVAALRELGSDAISVAVNVSDKASVDAMVREAVRQCGRLDILVNNAGISPRVEAIDLTLDQWWEVLNTNLTSALLCAQAAYPHMKATGGGKIICVASILSFLAASRPAYGASKGGMLQLARSLAVAWAKDNIQVNAVLPGFVASETIGGMLKAVPGLDEKVRGRAPAGRWGAPEDFEGIAVYLASRQSDFMTGSAIVIDGGYSMAI